MSRGPEYEITTKPVTLRAGAFAAEQLALERAYESDGLGRRRLPHPRAAVDGLAACRSTSASIELRRRGPRGRGRDRSQLHHRLRAGDRGERPRSVAARHPRHGADDVRDGSLQRLSAAGRSGLDARRRVRVGEPAAAEAVRSAARARGRPRRPASCRSPTRASRCSATSRSSSSTPRPREPYTPTGITRRVRAVRRRVPAPTTSATTSTRSSCSPAARSRTSTRSARRTRCRRDRSRIRSRCRARSWSAPTAGRSSRASSRPGSRCSTAATARPAWARPTRTTCSATSPATRARCCSSARARTRPAASRATTSSTRSASTARSRRTRRSSR